MKSRLATLLLLVGCVVGSVTSSVLEHRAEAARNSSGTYSLPSGNPVVSGTTITNTWANTTLSDISTELTNSLDRQGRGAMTAPLQLSSGSVAFPALTFASENNSGLYRAGTQDIRITVGNTDIVKFGLASVTFNQPVTATSSPTSVVGDVIVDSTGANAGTFTASTSGVVRLGGTTSLEGIASRRVGTPNLVGLDLYTNGHARLSITNGGLVQIPGAYETSPGTGISGSYAASPTLSWSLAGNATTTQTTTITGASTNSVCEVSANINAFIYLRCQVTSANTVTLTAANVDPGLATHTASSIQHFIRVWNN